MENPKKANKEGTETAGGIGGGGGGGGGAERAQYSTGGSLFARVELY